MERLRKELKDMPYDRRVYLYDGSGNTELAHATGYEVLIDGEWWLEYEDSHEDLHYLR